MEWSLHTNRILITSEDLPLQIGDNRAVVYPLDLVVTNLQVPRLKDLELSKDATVDELISAYYEVVENEVRFSGGYHFKESSEKMTRSMHPPEASRATL